MRPHHSLLIACSSVALVADACAQQDTLPPGIYMNIEDLKARRPAMKAKLQVSRRSGGDAAMSEGGDYKITDLGDSLAKKFLKREVFAYVSNDSLFLNCERQQLGPWYSLVMNRGEFLVFSTAKSYNGAIVTGAMLGGAIGGAVAGAMAGASNADNRQYFILSLSTGNSRTLTKEYLIARFKDRGKTELLEKFNAEPTQDWDFILLRYAELLNASLATGASSEPTK